MLPLKGLYGAPLALQDVAEAGYIRFVGVGASVAYVYPRVPRTPISARNAERTSALIPRFPDSKNP